MNKEYIEELHKLAMDNAEMAILSKRKGDHEKFVEYSHGALIYEKKAAIELFSAQLEPTRSVLFRSAGYLALDNADYTEAQKLYEYALEGNPPTEIINELNELKMQIDHVKLENEKFSEFIMTLLKGKTIPIEKEDIDEAFSRASRAFDKSEINSSRIREHIVHQYTIDSDPYSILDENFEPWIDKSQKGNWRFWARYKKFLIKDEKFAPDTVEKIDEITDEILDHLKNPTASGHWDKRGMVVGNVQSGKTSNYLALINKAADTGYKVIIVMAGMSNDLRSQTQFRIDRGFLGFDTQIERRLTASSKWGVGDYDSTLVPIPLTSSELDGDFKRSPVPTHGTGPYVFVVKKNKTILERLIRHLASSGFDMGDQKKIVADSPLLLIDDEADHASINVSRGSVSAINGLIRSLLSLFEKSAFVGYTATPFANIFIPLPSKFEVIERGINPNEHQFFRKCGEDLFPRDFIINIPPPSNYIGPAEVFGIDSSLIEELEEGQTGLPIVKVISDYALQIPDGHRHMDDLPQILPESLIYAIKCFILSCAIRRTRGDFKSHNSMLVHVTRFIRWQDKIAFNVNKQLKSIQRKIEFKEGEIYREMKKIWEEEYKTVTQEIIDDKRFVDPYMVKHEWYEIESQLHKASSKIEVRAIHGDKNEAGLNHKNITPLDYYDRKNGLSVIAVGGNKLSRGLTLEGLTISYYLRASKMYDTLMQMGRWFGYRSGYLDLCRIFTSKELINWYRFITVASNELREEFEEMNRLRKSPKQFGLKVRQHPDVLRVTATNKFRYSHEMVLSFSDKLRETSIFSRDSQIIERNYSNTADLIESLGAHTPNAHQQYVWYLKNNSSQVVNFLKGYTREENMIEHEKIIEYIQKQNEKNSLINWTICLISNQTNRSAEFFKINGSLEPVGLTMRTDIEKGEGQYYIIAKSHIIDPTHEFIDLDKSEEMYQNALRDTIKDWEENERKNKSPKKPAFPSGRNVRNYRGIENGLLLIYPLDSKPSGWKNSTIDVPIIGYAISFPKNENEVKVAYFVNQVFKNEYDYEVELDDVEVG